MSAPSKAQKRKSPPVDEGRDVSPPPTKRKIQSTTKQNNVASFFTPTSQKAPERTKWRTVNKTLLVAQYQPTDEKPPTERRRCIAAFDLDSTLISTASGKKFRTDASDWKWWDPCVPGELRRLHGEGYQIIIVSNQGGISLKSDSKSLKSDMKSVTEFKSKVTAVLNQLDLPLSLYAATEKDLYRKPRAGMWREMLEDYDLETGEGVDMQRSLFVGDAAGRSGDEDGMGKKDFACSDRDFAANVGIRLATPEEHFLKEDTRQFKRSFDPATYVKEAVSSFTFTLAEDKDIVLLCGSPGSGKSTFYWSHLEPLGYERVNQDILKTRDKCMKMASEYLNEGRSVAVDNTNADSETRAHWIELGKRSHVPVRCVHLQSDAVLCEHNNVVRALNGKLMNPEERALLPRMAFTGFASRFRAPDIREGFQDVVTVPFEFKGTDEQRAIWSRFWI